MESHHAHPKTDIYAQTTPSRGERGLCIIYFQISSLSLAVSVALRIPLSPNNLWGARVFPQPETMISALLPHATAHLSSHSPLSPPCLSSLVSAPLHHSQVAAATSCNRGRLSWSFCLTPGWNGRCEFLNISLFGSDEGSIFHKGGNKFHEESLSHQRAVEQKKKSPCHQSILSVIESENTLMIDYYLYITLRLFQPVNLIIRLTCHFISLDHSLETLSELLKMRQCGARLSSCFQFHYRILECQFSW